MSRSLLILQTSHPESHLRYLIEAFGIGLVQTPVSGDFAAPPMTTPATTPPTTVAPTPPATAPRAATSPGGTRGHSNWKRAATQPLGKTWPG